MQRMNWWDTESLLTKRDKEALSRAKLQHYGEIDVNEAETVLGREQMQKLILTKYHNEEYSAGMQ